MIGTIVHLDHGLYPGSSAKTAVMANWPAWIASGWESQGVD